MMKYLFVSDVHLGVHASRAQNNELERRFLLFLNSIIPQETTLFLLGDIFDFWFEYKLLAPATSGHAAVIGKLKLLRQQGCIIHFFKGNHDMWLRNYLSDEIGLTIHEKSEVVTIEGNKYMIGHGHDLCFSRTPVTRFMAWMFGSTFIFNLFTYLFHPNMMVRLGNKWSKSSRRRKTVCHTFAGEDEFLTKLLTPNLTHYRSQGIKGFIFGHFHAPTLYTMSDGASSLMILGEWSESENAYYGEIENGELILKQF